MTSIRNNASTEDRLLDAARECILAVGWRRTTLTDVARRAGVSRMTVYRTFPDMTSLFADLMTREWIGLVQAVAGADADVADLPGAVAARMVSAVRALRANPLFHRIVEIDPELLLPYLLQRRGRSQQAVLDLLEATIAEGQLGGGLRAGDPALLARTILLASQGTVLSGLTMTDGDVSEAQLDEQLALLIERYLAP